MKLTPESLYAILLGDDPTVEIAAYKVAQDLCHINKEKLWAIHFWNSQEIKGIGNGVGKAAKDEDGDAKQKRQEFAFSAELDGSSHDEAATDSEQETGKRTFSQSRLYNGEIRRQDVGLGIGAG